MAVNIVTARVSDKDMKFINENYPVFEAEFPDLEFEDFIGIFIHQGIQAMKRSIRQIHKNWLWCKNLIM
jgi:hypothetical protein